MHWGFQLDMKLGIAQSDFMRLAAWTEETGTNLTCGSSFKLCVCLKNRTAVDGNISFIDYNNIRGKYLCIYLYSFPKRSVKLKKRVL